MTESLGVVPWTLKNCTLWGPLVLRSSKVVYGATVEVDSGEPLGVQPSGYESSSLRKWQGKRLWRVGSLGL